MSFKEDYNINKNITKVNAKHENTGLEYVPKFCAIDTSSEIK